MPLPPAPGKKPLLVDLCCGPGGASTGYHRAGWQVAGIDNKPQPHYPFYFQRDDALAWLRRFIWHHPGEIKAIHASFPCQHFANVTRWRGDQDDHPDLLTPGLALLKETNLPWVVENVPEAIPHPDLVLCGSQFGLPVKRHRHFLLSHPPMFNLMPPCTCGTAKPFMHKSERAYADAMGCTWMTGKEARQAIPPAYTEFIGAQLLKAC